MKGLILKDFYCLRTSVRTLLCVSVFSLAMCVMCVLSMQYGNLAKLPGEFLEDGVDAAMTGVLWKMLLAVLVFLPMTLSGNVMQCFQEDKKSGFGKLEASMPLSAFTVVTARFGTLLLFGSVSFAVSAALALVSGALSPDFTAGELLRFDISLSGLLFIAVAVSVFMMYLVSSKWVDMLMALPVFAIVIIMDFVIMRSGEGMEVKIMEDMLLFVESKFWLFGVLGILAVVCAYIGSVLIVRKKRGIR